ncbi:MAG: TrmH family RNA methyltransferase [Actinomycetes bacterium]
MPIRITDPHDPRVADYVSLTDVALRRRAEPERGLYIAESEKVIRRALGAGHQPRSYLMAERWLTELADVVEGAEGRGIPVFVGEHDVIEQLTGFHLHRGALASMHRPQLPTVESLVADARGGRIAIFEDIVDHTNLGAGFRAAAALGVDAVLITPRCADPLYRRSIRVSMGTVFQVPWTRLARWPNDLELLRAAGFHTAALALSDDSITLDELALRNHQSLALILGTEGHGLHPATLAQVDDVVRIPMGGNVDSLNVAAAAAVAFYATRPGL